VQPPERFERSTATAEEQGALYAEQVEQLYSNALVGLLATGINSLALAAIQRDVTSRTTLVAWVALLAVISLLRYRDVRTFWRKSPEASKADYWARRFIVGLALSGMAWGSSAIFLFPIESLAHQTFLAFVIGGMVAGAAAAFSSVMEAFLVYSVPALSPIIVRFALLGDEFHLTMGGMVLLFGVMMFIVAKRIKTVRITSVKLRFENSGLVSYLTERKRMEEALRESEEKYRNLVEQSLQGTFVIQDMRIVFSNQAFANMSGYTLEEIYSLSSQELMNIVHPDDQKRVWDRFREGLEGRSLPTACNELRAFRKDGSIGLVEYDAVRINYSGRPAMLISIVEITKRGEAEKALRESEQRYRQLAESAQDFIFIINKDSKVQYVNSSAAKEFGCDSDQIIGKSVTELFPPEASKRQWDQIQRVIQSGHTLPNRETKVMFPTREVWLNTSLVPLRTEKGEVTQVLGIARNVTEFKQAEEALRESEKRYRQLSEENARLLEQARQDAQTKTILLHEVNHRVKNNLSSIIGLIQTQERFREKKGSPEFRSMCKDLTSRVQGLASVHKLLSAADWSSVKLADLATGVIHSTMQILPADHRLSVHVSPSSTQVSPDQANTLALVINELATNTIKHGQRGKDAPSISVRIEENDGQILFEFQDNGPGYPEPILNEEHYNMGLYLVTNLVRRDLRGEVTLHSDHGAVTRIRFGSRRS
jgi:PAS domain S-box-containing protein